MIYAVGDIHGELGKLHRLLARIEPRLGAGDRLVFIGDYIDRGPDVCGVIELMLRLRDARPSTVFLRGNHEQEMLDSRAIFESDGEFGDFEQAANWFAMGGAETLESYPRARVQHWFDRVPDSHWEFLRNTVLEYREGPYIFVHAGLAPAGVSFGSDDPRLWIREPFLSTLEDFGWIVVFGHTPQRSGRPLVMLNKIGIDTAAAYGGPLTAVALDPSLPYNSERLEFFRSA